MSFRNTLYWHRLRLNRFSRFTDWGWRIGVYFLLNKADQLLPYIYDSIHIYFGSIFMKHHIISSKQQLSVMMKDMTHYVKGFLTLLLGFLGHDTREPRNWSVRRRSKSSRTASDSDSPVGFAITASRNPE